MQPTQTSVESNRRGATEPAQASMESKTSCAPSPSLLSSDPSPIRVLFTDIGGVLLTNGWDRGARNRAAEKFHLDPADMDERHHLTFDTYEEGKLGLDEYLNRTVFYRRRPFSRNSFREFMYAQSAPFPEMLQLVKAIKQRHNLKVVAISNEGRELTVHRIQNFGLQEVIDFFISSCFVHFRKPDADIYRIALDAAQVPPSQTVYIDDRSIFVEVACSLGMRGILHESYESTRLALEKVGLGEK